MHVTSKGKKSSPIAKDINFSPHIERKNPNRKQITNHKENPQFNHQIHTRIFDRGVYHIGVLRLPLIRWLWQNWSAARTDKLLCQKRADSVARFHCRFFFFLHFYIHFRLLRTSYMLRPFHFPSGVQNSIWAGSKITWPNLIFKKASL